MGERTKPGHWYFFVECVACNEDIILAEAPPPEKIETPRHAGVKLTCPYCQTEGTYHGARVQRGVTEENE